MSDEVDKANADEELIDGARVKAAQAQAAKIDPGYPGECYECGVYFSRIIKGFCARCRDDLGLP